MSNATASETMAGEPFMGIGTYNGNYGVAKLTLTNVTVDGFTYGLYFGQNPSGNTNPINDKPVSIVANALTVKNSYAKGIYVEKLTNSTFTNCAFTNNGHDTSKVADGIATWMCGVDMNLKNGIYQNITFDGCTFTGNGANRGTALHIKARGTGTDNNKYGTDTTLTGVTITGCTFTGNNAVDTGASSAAFGPVVFGEPGKGNTSPTNISIQKDVSFTNNLAGVVEATFDSNGGSTVSTMITAANAPIPLPSAPTKTGYSFNGWSDGENTYGAGAQVTLTADTTFTAQWTAIPSTGGGSSSSGSGSSSSNTETEKNPDGSTTTTVTKPDGSTTETTKQPDGSTTTVATDKNGNVETTVKLPSSVVTEAAEKGEAVALPMDSVKVSSDSDDASPITVDLPNGTSAKVEIPVRNVSAGTVAILVKADGTEQVIKTTVATEDGVALTVEDGATVKIVDNAKDFADVSADYWAADAIDFATSRELFAGTSATTFTPVAPMTRAMIVTVLARYTSDAPSSEIGYAEGQQWAVESGISDGSNMNGTVSRQQLATMLYRYAGSPVVSGDLNAFPDASSVSDYAKDALSWAVEEGLIGGMNDGSLNPYGLATRAQVATILMRFVAASN